MGLNPGYSRRLTSATEISNSDCSESLSADCDHRLDRLPSCEATNITYRSCSCERDPSLVNFSSNLVIQSDIFHRFDMP